MTAQPATWTRDEMSAWRPPDRLTVSEWADRHRVLDAKTAAEAGRYSSSRTPYAREWMNSANVAHVRQVTIIAGTQIGKTETLNNVLGFAIHQDPAPAMVVVPRNQDVQLMAQRRLQPMVDASPALTAELTGSDHDVKNRELCFRRSIVYLRSSQSPADLASVPVRYLLADEVDKFPKWAGHEAAPLDLAKERQRTFWNSIAYVTTTPTTRDATGWTEYQDGDRRRYFVPCPICDAWQVLQWGQVKYPKGVDARTMRREHCATYECAHCGESIPDAAKRDVLARGVWVPAGVDVADWTPAARDADRADHRSYHINAAYSPWLTWSDLAAQWLIAKDRPERLQNWVNSWLAEPWEDKIEAPAETSIDKAIVPGFKLGSVPDGVLVATAGIDVQADGLWVVVRGWGWNDHTWLLFAGKVASFADLDDVLTHNVWTSQNSNGVRCGVIDSRHRRDECVEYVRRRPAIKLGEGVDRIGPLDFTTHKLERHPTTGAYLKQSVLIWSITVGRFKDSLAAKMRDPATWHLPEDVTDDYRRQATAEHKVRKRVRNREREIWVTKPGRDANHLFDCEVYALAAAKMIRVELLRKGDDQAAGVQLPPAPGGRRQSQPPPRRRDRAERPNFPRLGE